MNFIVASEITLPVDSKVHKLILEIKGEAVDSPLWLTSGIHVVAERVEEGLSAYSKALFIDVCKASRKKGPEIHISILSDAPVSQL